MAAESHIEWLLAGQESWNRKRESHDFRPAFWRVNFVERFRDAGKLDPNGRVPLDRFNLSNAVFHLANLSQVDFQGTYLRRARFQGAVLFDTNFSQADLTDAEFGPNFLGEANLSSATLENTDLIQTNLVGANLSWSRFWQAKLYPESSDLGGSNTQPDTQIESVSHLIEKCFEIRKHYEGCTLFFRGERDCTWELRPSVMRPAADDTFKLRAHEDEMLRDLMSRRPEDFLGMNSALEQMVMAQHHGLKTRLLDVSHNPCVALFSACDSRDPAGKPLDNDMNGRLHVFAVPKESVKPFDSDTVSLVCNFAKLDRGYQHLLLGRHGEDSLAEDPDTQIQYLYSEAMGRLYHYIQQEKPHFAENIDPKDFFRVFVVEPKQSFPRIRAQRGAFILSAFHERLEKDEIQSRISDVPIYAHETLIVPSESKNPILEELSLLDFTRETLYPSLDEVANRITGHYL